MDIFLTPVLRTVILLIGRTHITVHQMHKPRAGKNSVGGSYLFVRDEEFIYFNFSDIKNGASGTEAEKINRRKIAPLIHLSDFDYQAFVELFRKEFKEK